MWLCLLAVIDARAQEGGFDALGFRMPAADADPRDPLTFLRPGAQQALDGSLGFVGGYASRPLVFETEPGQVDAVLSNLVAVDVAAGFAPTRGFRLGVEAPVVLASDGPQGGQPAGLGDLGASVLAMVAHPDSAGGFGLGFTGFVTAPTGDPLRYRGEHGLTGGGGVVGTVEASALTVSWYVGGRFSPSQPVDVRPAPTRGGDVLEGGLHLGLLASERLGFGVEAHGDYAIDPTVRGAIGTPAQALLSARYAAPNGLFWTAGVGTGLGQGAGASPLRAMMGAGLALRGGPPSDLDGDGVVDRLDQCVDVPETINGYVDNDGCADQLPRIEFLAEAPVQEAAEASIVVHRPNGTVVSGKGTVVVEGRPGQPFRATALVGACRAGQVVTEMEATVGTVYQIPVAYVTGQVEVTVRDGAGRALEGTTVRYLTEEIACAPEDTSIKDGEGVHTMGTGPHTLLITAPGYDIHQQEIEVQEGGILTIDAVLSPTQVRVEGDRVAIAAPVLFEAGTSEVSPAVAEVLSQIATLLMTQDLKVRVTGYTDPGGQGGRRLSWARAEAVLSYLRAQGVPAAQMVSNGHTGASDEGHIDVRILP
ncbi:MAG: OmpA family protein [Myxococcales bacterium]|nr:OmpA family protein [Myxococcales bacterium]